jgi:CspA family cold shock protein
MPGRHHEQMTIVAAVRVWHDEDGWGVVDSPDTPGGCWVHYSHVAMAGWRSLTPGQLVELDYESALQDGYAFRATCVWPHGTRPDPPPEAAPGPSAAYRSSLTISFDD